MACPRGLRKEPASPAEAFSRPWHFVLGVAALEQLPAGDRGEIAFAGRSNVGKSSLINALVRQHRLARTSNTPGRTQELNFFAAEVAPVYIVDLPGYGYAAAPRDKVEAWTRLVRDYLRGRRTLARVYLLIDSRHGIKPVDEEIMTLLDSAAVSYQIVLTKLDKLKPREAEAVIGRVRERLAAHPAAYPEVIATSAVEGAGLDELREAIVAALTGGG